MNIIVSHIIEPCDVVVALSGCFHKSVIHAKNKFGAKVIIECGSRHILSQKEISDFVKRQSPHAFSIREKDVINDLKDYEIADWIVVPAKHVAQSFLERGIPNNKLFRNQYGVDLNMFDSTSTPTAKPTVVMTGTWCYRKGVDLLWEAIKETDYYLIHAGPIGDCPYPNSSRFKNYGKLDQSKLKDIYSMAHVMVLPSREEGLAMVQAQALACGLPLVCSDKTGGEDYLEFLENVNLVTVVNSDDVNDLRKGMIKAMNYALNHQGHREIPLKSKEQMSWKAYGRRYNEFLKSIIK